MPNPRSIPSAELGQIMARLPAGTDTAAVVQKLRQRGHSVEGYAEPAPTPTTPTEGMGRGLARRGLALLPSAGGMAGGILGGGAGAAAGGIGAVPGAMVGGGIGAGAGRVLQNVGGDLLGLDREPGTAEAAMDFLGAEMPEGIGGEALDVFGEAGLGSILERLGLGAAGRVQKTGQGAINRALKPTPGLREQFPNVAKTAAEAKIPIGPGAKAAASAMRRASAAETRTLLTEANKAGIRIPIDDMASVALQREAQAIERPLTSKETEAVIAKVYERAQQILGEQRIATTVNLGRRAKPTVAQQIKRGAQKAAKGARAAQAQGQPVTGDANLDDAIAKGVRQALENSVKGVGKTNARTQELIGLERAMGKAEAMPEQIRVSSPVRPLGMATPDLSLSRANLSRIGYGMNSPAVAGSLRQSPRLLEALLSQLLMEEDGIE